MKKRLITGIIGGAFFLTLVFTGGIGFGILLFFIALIGYYEWLRMNSIHIGSIQSLVGLLFTLLYFLPSSVMLGGIKVDYIMMELLLLLTIMVLSKNKAPIQEMAYIFIGSVYIGVSLHYMFETRMLENGLILTLAILAGIWATDSAAYFVGRAIGKHKLWPTISPKKTIEGSLGGILVAILVILCFSLFGNQISFSLACILGLSVSISGQVGDLVESAVKRTLGVKDSGQILPGHGGVLDRFDSLLFVYPVLHLLSLI
ncbi:MAG TPA: phosphatidate cytidylyltransferase [Bacillota bacterium]|nr:phosphatidate cytidylyltransferase [Bacillota bacterium]